ncbi:hypothetical protein A2970_00295 [Candidatus Roizmanbacteria bacterium RIFCSPLOWO2_01_FULL_44_13]|uniref:Uncharacterized protein n=1 Tax=Candidatus Roizmanbacteria bacterium RIFCSPLOWO2_01_FULL_44_13 TaxID=1802069 RepID=A0A1F7JAF8_9BACT|nr:MAG: hypothetical protein A2970_00295 [Candidatus Roizmanbacteria bacterium RIFCSPLOWO2_01_FULL_44_13]
MFLDTKIESLPNTSFVTIRRLKSIGIKNYFDLLNYFPSRYENYSLVSKIKNLQMGETVTITGKVVEGKFQITRRGLRLQVFKIEDETGTIKVTFFNQPYLLRLIKPGLKISIAGRVAEFGRQITVEPKEYEILYDGSKHTGRIIPIYPLPRGLSSRIFREKISYVLANLDQKTDMEFLPDPLIKKNQLPGEKIAITQVHFPASIDAASNARRRLAFDELFTIQLSSLLVKQEWKKEIVASEFVLNSDMEKKVQAFIKNLPFTLTGGQKNVWQEIKNDLSKKQPMNRFLQGEVGSGKTVVAALAAYLAYLNGYQTMLMAPTEILAQQHYKTISKLFSTGSNDKVPKIALLTGSQKIKRENYDIIIGTHALISKKNQFDRVGLVVVDEQHRFGVAQRQALKEKGLNPHLLTMTATPIPRTVALTLYNELDLSYLNEQPVDRLPVKTFYVPKIKRASCYEWIKKQIDMHSSQVFIVCPLIEDSSNETMKSLKAAKSEFEYLKTEVFYRYGLGLLHGKLKSKEKEKIMTDFKNKVYDILVTTPVVEVGIDIPNATIILIEAAERFGLASLHQMRGRVGRGKKQSYCFVFSEVETPQVVSRLKFFAKTPEGNILAEKDLENRGAGNIYGLEQHGIVALKIASMSDFNAIKKTRDAAVIFMNNYKMGDYPELEKRLDKKNFQRVGRD